MISYIEKAADYRALKKWPCDTGEARVQPEATVAGVHHFKCKIPDFNSEFIEK